MSAVATQEDRCCPKSEMGDVEGATEEGGVERHRHSFVSPARESVMFLFF